MEMAFPLARGGRRVNKAGWPDGAIYRRFCYFSKYQAIFWGENWLRFLSKSGYFGHPATKSAPAHASAKFDKILNSGFLMCSGCIKLYTKVSLTAAVHVRLGTFAPHGFQIYSVTFNLS